MLGRESSSAMEIPGSNRRSESSYDGANSNSPHNSYVMNSFVMPNCTQLANIDAEALPKPFDSDNDLNHIPLLSGEEIETNGKCDLGTLTLMLTNYRLCTTCPEEQLVTVVPLLSMESVDFRDLNQILISCKDGRVVRLNLPSQEDAIRWHKRLLVKTASPQKFTDAFAITFAKSLSQSQALTWIHDRPANEIVYVDFERLKMKDDFRVSHVNSEYKICETYPEKIIVPLKVTDEQLKTACKFRSMNRLPAIVWKNQHSNAVLLRSSQPLTTLFSWRSNDDERIIEEVINYTKQKNKNLDGTEDKKHMVILDARSYAAAWANRAKGGGFESYEYYQQTEILFLGLPNIHNVRYSFTQLRSLLTSIEQANFHQNLQASNWLIYLSNLLIAANKCAEFLQQGTSVLVHCTDGWDRTTQIVSLAKLILDDYYRTIKGFEELIRREWLAFGHKFADRSGIGCLDANERSPVFLQWLDAVRQLQSMNSSSFQFNHQYLIKLARHTYSGLFETFLFNSQKQRDEAIRDTLNASKGATTTNGINLANEPISIWQYLGKHNEEFVNLNYDNESKGRLKNLNLGVQHLRVWLEVYTCMNTQPQPELSTLAAGVNGSIASPLPSTAQIPSVASQTTVQVSHQQKDAAMTKSKSSESLNSLTKEADGATSMSGQHSGSNGTVNSITDCHVTAETQMHESISRNTRERQSRTLIKRAVTDSLSSDGLEIFYDPDQEALKKKEKRQKKVLKKKEIEIMELRVQQQMANGSSEKTNGHNHHRDSHAGSSFAESELDDTASLNRSLSEVSVIDPSEVPLKHKGWSVDKLSCELCQRPWKTMSIYAESREHHCRQCGCAVCLECSPHTYQTFKEGKSVQERACKKCYASMVDSSTKILPDELEKEEESEQDGLRQSDGATDDSANHTPTHQLYQTNGVPQNDATNTNDHPAIHNSSPALQKMAVKG